VKQEFIDFLNELMKAAPHIEMSPNVKAYIDALTEQTEEKPVLTDNGKLILRYLQDNTDKSIWKARDIAEGLFISPRGVSGALRKLVNDGFVDKMGESPVLYSLNEKGKNYIIEE
jgi:DNA-binding MarR family transcriptional regulator